MWSLFWIINKKSRYESDSLWIRVWLKDFVPWDCADLREPILFIVGIHGFNLISTRSTQDLDNFYDLIDTALPREDWHCEHELCDNTSN